MRKERTVQASKYGGKKTLVDENGEAQEVQVIKHEASEDCNFSKVWIGHIIQALDLIGNAKIQVISYIIENMNYENMLAKTQQEIADDLDISRQTVSQTIVALREAEFIETRPGLIFFNPDVIWKGKHKKRMLILHEYRKINEDEEKENKEKTQSTKDNTNSA